MVLPVFRNYPLCLRSVFSSRKKENWDFLLLVSCLFFHIPWTAIQFRLSEYVCSVYGEMWNVGEIIFCDYENNEIIYFVVRVYQSKSFRENMFEHFLVYLVLSLGRYRLMYHRKIDKKSDSFQISYILTIEQKNNKQPTFTYNYKTPFRESNPHLLHLSQLYM